MSDQSPPTSLRVQLSGGLAGALTMIDVFDEGLTLVTTVEARIGVDATIAVSPGRYLVDVRTPAGDRVRKLVTAREGVASVDVALELATAIPESMAPAAQVEARSRRSLDPDPLTHFEAAIAEYDPALGWVVVSTPEGESSAPRGTIFRAGDGGTRLRAASIGAGGAPLLVTMLPTGWPGLGPTPAQGGIAIFVHAAGERGSDHAAISPDSTRLTTTRKGDPVFDGLVAFAHAGDTAAVSAASAVSKLGEERLGSELRDPVGAALGAYVLLRLRDLGGLRRWTATLATSFPWLPDGAIASAWSSILAGDKRGVIDDFERAIEAGPPIFSEGLRLLGDGLNLLADEEPERVKALKERTRPARAAWLRNQPFTTFHAPRLMAYAPEMPTKDVWAMRFSTA